MHTIDELARKLEQIGEWHKEAPASDGDVTKIQAEVRLFVGHSIPEDYISFLRWANGGEGTIGGVYVSLWPTQELVQLNKDYQVDKWMPNALVIGTDGGSKAYIFDFRDQLKEPPLYRKGFGDLLGGLEDEYATRIANSFTEWLASLLEEK